jgi:membrane fusion protein (multidrug efflux system)
MKLVNVKPRSLWSRAFSSAPSVRAWGAAVAVLLSPLVSFAQNAELVSVVSKPLSQTVELPGQLEPFLSVALHARVSGYVESVLVDRGSNLKAGDTLIQISAPEIKAQIAEAEAKVQAAQAELVQSQAQLEALRATYDRLKKASETPGAVAGNELIQADKQIAATQALMHAREQAIQSAQASLRAQQDLAAYLTLTAPFDGVVTERLVHPGALVGPNSDAALLTIQQVVQLRLVVPVPEENVGAIADNATVSFTVPAYADRSFSGKIARRANVLDPRTRSMPVELDVVNRDGALAPGMYASVKWPVHRARPALMVPRTSIVTTTERTFVIRDRNGNAEWVDVKPGSAQGDLVEIIGSLKAGDKVVRRGTDEIRPGAALR